MILVELFLTQVFMKIYVQMYKCITHILTKMAPVAFFSFFGPIIFAVCIKSVTVLIFC